MKYHLSWIGAFTLVIVGTLLVHTSAGAEQPPPGGLSPAEIAQWNEGLSKAGASPVEIGQFAELLRLQSSAGLDAWRGEGRMPQFFAQYLRRGLQTNGRQKARQAIYHDDAPIRSCDSLLDVAIPNTKIDATKVDDLDGSCRVTASVTHPPASDRVRVFVALPRSSWNGRFRGTGGGGFWGGTEMSLRSPVSRGYVTAATDTGHQGGSGSFALNANGRLNWQDIRDNAYLGIHDMTVVGKALTVAFYGKAPRYSYFVGSSTAGPAGLMEGPPIPGTPPDISPHVPPIRCPTIDLAPSPPP